MPCRLSYSRFRVLVQKRPPLAKKALHTCRSTHLHICTLTYLHTDTFRNLHTYTLTYIHTLTYTHTHLATHPPLPPQIPCRKKQCLQARMHRHPNDSCPLHGIQFEFHANSHLINTRSAIGSRWLALWIGSWARHTSAMGAGQCDLAANSNLYKIGQCINSCRMLRVYFPIYSSYSY